MTPEEKAKDLELMAERLQRGAGSTVVLGTGIHNEPNVDSDNENEGGDMKDGPSHQGGQAQQGWGGGQVEDNDFDAPDNPDGGQNSARGDGQVSGRREKADYDDAGGQNTGRGSRNTRPTSGSVQRGPTLKANMSSNGDSEPIVQQSKVAEQPKKFGRRQPGFGGTTAEIKKGPTDRFETTETVTDLKEIPDLDAEAEERTEEFTQKIEHAPNVRAKQVQTLQDLDQNIMGQLSSITADGIDLSLLTSVLAPPEQVVEPDSMWDYDSVFAQLSSEMQPENEGDDEEGASSPTNAGGKDNSSSGNGGPPMMKPPAGIEFKETKKPN